MLNARLNINGVDVPYLKDIPVSVNYSVTDIRSPEDVHGSFTKTIQVPMTKEVNDLFEMIFEVNIDLQTFNPNLKSDAAFYKEEIQQFKGSAQLLKIHKNYDGNTIPGYYEISILGENGNIFVDIGDAYLTDIDFSDLNHTWTNANLNWTPTLGTGYLYPFIDYGFSGGNNGNWKFTDLKPAIFVREYLRRIFAAAGASGYTWSSAFLDSTFFKHLIIPDSNEGKLKLPFATTQNNQFYAGRTSDGPTINFSGAFVSGPNWWNYPGYGSPTPATQLLEQFPDDSTLPFNDPGNVYNTGTFIFTVGQAGTYNISTTDTFTFQVTPPAGTVSIPPGGQGLLMNVLVEIHRSLDGGATWSTIGQTGDQFTIYDTSIQTRNISVNAQLNASTGHKFRVAWWWTGTNGIVFLDGSNNPITSGTSTLDVIYKSASPGTTFAAALAINDLAYGQTVDMNQTIPKDIKQKDFFKSIIQMFNLRLEPDKNDPTILYIEPHNDFYFPASQALNWEKKFDSGKEIEVIPMGELDSRRYEWQYKSDKDKFNVLYEDEFKRTYGKMWLDVQNDFIKNIKTTEVVFSATPIAAYATSNMVVPHLYQQIGAVTNIKCNIRILYWGGMKNCNGYNWDVSGTISTQTQYPYAGHVDDPYGPTLDLCWRYPSRIYWSIPAQTYTNNGLYGAYWSKFITEITDKNSKILTAYFALNENDISTFTFRKLIYADLGGGGAYYYVNKIIDYNPLVREVTKLELLKVKEAETFVGITIGGDLGGSGLGPGGGMDDNGGFYQIAPFNPSFNYLNNVNSSQSQSYGRNNQVLGTGFLVLGENNGVCNG